MKCSDLHRKLIFYNEGTLPENEMAQVREHLHECRECETFANELELTLGFIEREKAFEPNPFFYTRVKAKIENIGMEAMKPRWQPVLVRVLQSAMFSILLLTGIYGGFKIGQPSGYSVREKSATEQELFPLLNEMNEEPIESFLME